MYGCFMCEQTCMRVHIYLCMCLYISLFVHTQVCTCVYTRKHVHRRGCENTFDYELETESLSAAGKIVWNMKTLSEAKEGSACPWPRH